MPNPIEAAFSAVASPVISGMARFNRWRLPARVGPHPLLTGVHEPMAEELTLPDLPVTGTIPAELAGRYLRIGPNPVDADPRVYHWFVGDGMVHGVRLAGGRAAWYRNRWVRSAAVAKARGGDPAPGPRHGGFDTVNTSVVAHAGAAYACVEAGSTPVRLGPELDGQRYDDFDGTLPGSFTAHPRRDPTTGELHAVCYEALEPGRVRYNVVAVDGRVRRSVEIPVRHGPLIHDCAITARYVLILDLPITLSLASVMGGREFPYVWNDRHPARLGLMPRDGGAEDIAWLPIEPCFVFHTVNAFDLPDGRVALDAIVYDRMFDRSHEGPDQRPRGLERWLVDPGAGTVERQLLDGAAQELPRCDERRTGLPYRYAYAGALPDEDQPALVGPAPLIKHDLAEGRRFLHDFGAGRVAGEFVFVPRAPDAREDEGWLVGLVINADGRSTDLEILDAHRVEEAPVAAVHLPHRVPPGFHGAWVADGDARG